MNAAYRLIYDPISSKPFNGVAWSTNATERREQQRTNPLDIGECYQFMCSTDLRCSNSSNNWLFSPFYIITPVLMRLFERSVSPCYITATDNNCDTSLGSFYWSNALRRSESILGRSPGGAWNWATRLYLIPCCYGSTSAPIGRTAISQQRQNKLPKNILPNKNAPHSEVSLHVRTTLNTVNGIMCCMWSPPLTQFGLGNPWYLCYHITSVVFFVRTLVNLPRSESVWFLG